MQPLYDANILNLNPQVAAARQPSCSGMSAKLKKMVKELTAIPRQSTEKCLKGARRSRWISDVLFEEYLQGENICSHFQCGEKLEMFCRTSTGREGFFQRNLRYFEQIIIKQLLQTRRLSCTPPAHSATHKSSYQTRSHSIACFNCHGISNHNRFKDTVLKSEK